MARGAWRRMTRARRRHVLVLAMVMAGVGCTRGEIVSGVSDSTYVAAMTELRKVQTNPTLDSLGRAAARRAVLQRRGLTADKLERAAAALARDPDRASRLFTAIEERAGPAR